MGTADDDQGLQFVRECVLLGRRWRARADESLREMGTTLSRATVLYWINALPEGATQRELADVVGIEGPTLVRLLHALEAQGLVERIAVPGDRRAKALKLTPAAKPMLDDVNTLAANMSRELLSGLDRRRLSSALKLLAEARKAIG